MAWQKSVWSEIGDRHALTLAEILYLRWAANAVSYSVAAAQIPANPIAHIVLKNSSQPSPSDQGNILELVWV